MTDTERTVHCARLGEDLPGLAKPPIPGAFGQRIYDEISQQAWDQWTDEEVLVINHYALSLANPRHLDFLMEKMKAWLFEGAEGVDTSKPPEDRPPDLDS